VSIQALIGEGVSLAAVLWLTVWGLTIPIRWMFRAMGFHGNA
jgi:hypothetical protein